MSSKRLARSRRRHAEESRVWTDADLAEAGYPCLHVRMMPAVGYSLPILWTHEPLQHGVRDSLGFRVLDAEPAGPPRATKS